jgi:formamidopyrimidine-DNA glycosylase
MPELPEVETVVRGLDKYLPGKKIVSVDFDWPKSFPNSQQYIDNYLLGAGVVGLRRRGKVIIIDLDTEYCLVIHLKMTGQLVYRGAEQHFGAGHPSQSLQGTLPDKSTRVIFKLVDSLGKTSKLFFNDQRKFGWARLLPTVELPSINFLTKMGPEPLEETTTTDVFKSRINKRKNSKIKAVLLDQTVIAGIGNIYADESLWLAKIHPEQPVNKISNSKMNKLFTQIKDVLELSINSGGSTDKNYVDADGNKGSFLTFANVFRRQGQACKRCGETIIKLRVAGRGTHICPKCQRLLK